MPTGIWLPEDTYLQQQGQLWLQAQQQAIKGQMQAGQDWASQQIARIQQQTQAQVQAITQPAAPAPTVAPTTPPPAPIPVAPPTPAPTPVAAPPPATPAVPPPAAGLPTPTPTQPPAQPIQAPLPSDMLQAGQDWASQQIQNLTNPSTSTSTSAQPTPAPIPAPIPAPSSTPSAAPPSAPTLPSTPAASSATAGMGSVPAGPQPNSPGDLIDQARQAAAKYGIDPEIFTRQIQQESGFNPTAQSPAGAIGIAQFMPGTAQGMNIDPTNPQQSLDAAAKMDAQNLQKYQGDWSKTLAAYNAGGGNVDQYGGVPPFAETQSYVKTILGGAQNVLQQVGGAVQQAAGNVVQGAQNAVSSVVQTGQTAVNTLAQGAQAAAARVSQFAMGLSSGDAMAFCGPAAAMAFAQTYGRNPTVDEAKQLAQQVGWTAQQGMAGVQSEVKLLGAMGIDAHATQGVDWASVGRDAQGGNPVIIDTPGHYYYVDGYNADTGQFHVGTSGTDLKGGSEWMTSDQINQMPQSEGAARAAVFADHPLASQPGLAQSTAQSTGTSASSPTYMTTMQPAGPQYQNPQSPYTSPQDLLSKAQNQVLGITSAVQSKANDVLSAVQNVGGNALNAGQNLLATGVGSGQSLLNQAVGTGQNLLSQASQAPTTLSDLYQNATNVSGQTQLPGILNNLAQNPTAQDVGSNILAPLLGLPNRTQNGALPAINSVFDALNPQVTPQAPLGRAVGWLAQHPELVGQGISGTAQDINAVAGPALSQGGVLDATQVAQDLANKYGTLDSSRYTPEDQQRLAQASIAIGGMQMPQEAGPNPVTWGERARALQQGVISDPATATKVVMSSILNPVWSGVTRTGADILGAVTPGGIDSTEALGRIQGRGLGAMTGLVNAGDALARNLGSIFDPNLRPNSIAARATNPIDQIFGQVTQAPGALHAAFMNAGQEVLTQMEYQASAGQRAVQNGFTPGTQAFTDEVARMVANPDPQLMQQAQDLAARAVGRGQLGTLGQHFADLAGQGQGQAGYARYSIGNALFPVFRIGWNLLTQGVEKSPLGLAGTAFDVARAAAGSGPYAGGAFEQPLSRAVTPLSERLTNNVVGTALTGWLAYQAMQGNVTGDGPADPGERQVWIAQGNQPHSVQVPGVGWVSYQGTPLETQLGLAGDFADALSMPMNQRELQQPFVDTAAERLFGGVLNSLASRTGMETMGQISDLLHGMATDAPTAVNQLATGLGSNILGSYVPMSGLLRGVERATDPYQRQALPPAASQGLGGLPGAIGQALEQNIPGLAQNVPARVDVLGRQMVNPQQGLAALLPIRQTPGQPSAALSAMQYSGIGVSPPPQTVNYGPYDQITLTPQQRQQWEQLRGQVLQNALGGLRGPFQPTDKKNLQFAVNLADRIATNVANLQILGVIQRDPNSAAPIPRPGSLTAPAQSYTPGVFSLDPLTAIIGNQSGLQALQTQMAESQHLRRQQESAAMMQSLLGG